jgi:hypothetical protein
VTFVLRKEFENGRPESMHLLPEVMKGLITDEDRTGITLIFRPENEHLSPANLAGGIAKSPSP